MQLDSPVNQILKAMKSGEIDCKKLRLNSWLFNQYPDYPIIPTNERPNLDTKSFEQLVKEIEKYVIDLEQLAGTSQLNNFMKCFISAGGDIDRLGTTLFPNQYTICVRLSVLLKDSSTYKIFCKEKGIYDEIMKEQEKIFNTIKNNPNIRLNKEQVKILNITNTGGQNVLHRAIRNNNINLVKLLLNIGVNPNIPEIKKITDYSRLFGIPNKIIKTETPLEIAINNNNDEIVDILLDSDAGITIEDKQHGNTILHIVAKKCMNNLLTKLLKRTRNVNIKNNDGWTPLDLAVSYNCTEAVDILLNNDAVINMNTIGFAKNDVILNRLLSNFNINQRDDKGDTLLHKAARYSNNDLFEILLSKGLSLNDKNNDGRTPLDIVISKTNKKIIELLLLNKLIDPNMMVDKRNLIHHSILQNDDDLLRTLLENGANPNIKDTYGNTALMLAANEYNYSFDPRFEGHEDIIELLLEYGADPEITDNEGKMMMDRIEGKLFTNKRSIINNLIKKYKKS